MARTFSVGALIATAVSLPATSAEAQIPANIHVVSGSARILRSLGPANEVILTVDQGTTLEVLDQEEDWYWVVLPPDVHGTRKVGWIRTSGVEPVLPPAKAQRDDAQAPAPAAVARSTSAVPAGPAAAEDKVTLSVGTKSYTFEDVRFDRDRDSLRREDIDRLRAVVTALKGDPSLVVTIEGHTCSLGTASYNLGLGNRRATAVKDYLVSEGVPADRLPTVSRGEEGAKYDNAREDTRRLNRRVALVPQVER